MRSTGAGAEFFNDPERKPLYDAPCLILLSTTVADPAAGNVPYSNAAVIVENMSLAATDLGLGSCLIWGLHRRPEPETGIGCQIRSSEGQVPSCGLVLGETAEILRKERSLQTGFLFLICKIIYL